MSELKKAVRVGIDGLFYSLAHVPDLVRYGSKPLRELRANPALGDELKQKLRDFSAAVAYAPHQAYIGNIDPERLSDLPKPWYDKLIEGATFQGRFGDLVEQNRFYFLLATADQFDLVSLENGWFHDQDAQPNVLGKKLHSTTEIQTLCDKGALPLYSGERLIGAFEAAHPEDASLAAEVLLENLAAKVTAAHSLRALCKQLDLDPGESDCRASWLHQGFRLRRKSFLRRSDVRSGAGCESRSIRCSKKSRRRCGRIIGETRHEIRVACEKEHAGFGRCAGQLCRDSFCGKAWRAVRAARFRCFPSSGGRRFAPGHGGKFGRETPGQIRDEADGCRSLRCGTSQSRDHRTIG
jgi:hypothetical protein